MGSNPREMQTTQQFSFVDSTQACKRMMGSQAGRVDARQSNITINDGKSEWQTTTGSQFNNRFTFDAENQALMAKNSKDLKMTHFKFGNDDQDYKTEAKGQFGELKVLPKDEFAGKQEMLYDTHFVFGDEE